MSNYIKLFIKTIDGRGDYIVIDLECDTVLRLKKMLSGLFNIPVKEERLIFCGKELSDECMLGGYLLSDATTLHLVQVNENEELENNEEKISKRIDYMIELINKMEDDYQNLEATNELLLSNIE